MRCRALQIIALTGLLLSCEKTLEKTHTSPRAQVAQRAETEQTEGRAEKKIAPTLPASLRNLPPASTSPSNWGKGVAAHGRLGVVTSVDDAATRAGVSILEKGGNAVDSAVATALALAVTHPSAGNLGGGGFLLLKLGDVVEAIDFRENSPAKLTDKDFWKMIRNGGRGPQSVGCPGTVAGLFLAHSRHGKLSWEDVVSPAEKLALEGYPLGERQAKTIQWAERDLRRSPVARQRFFPGGRRVRSGELIKRPDLALALGRVKESGPKGFYEGPTAEDLIGSLGDDALLSLDDLKNYKAVVRKPLFFDFLGYRVITMPAPSAGGVALTQGLLMLRELHIESTEADSADRLHLVAEVSRRAQVERQLFVVSPDEQTPEAKKESRRRALDPETWLKEHPVDLKRATLSKSLHPDFDKVLEERRHTTHFSVIDADGGLVSCTVTLSGSFGSRVFSKETGIVLNNSVASFSSIGANTPSPGKRTTSSMAPTLALQGEDNALVLGSPGGDTIPSTITQSFLRLALDGDSLQEAVNKARFHQAFVPQGLSVERTRPLDPALLAKLRKFGHTMSPSRSTIGDANIAAKIGAISYAAADPREGGLALAAAREAAAQ